MKDRLTNDSYQSQIQATETKNSSCGQGFPPANQYFAHSPHGEQKNWESVTDHANAVAKKAFELADNFGFGDLAAAAGLLHDIGKYQPSFQRKIKGQNSLVEHSICGAKEALELFAIDKSVPINVYNREILAYIVAAHHSGLPDVGSEADNFSLPTLTARLGRTVEDYSAYKSEIPIDRPDKFWARDFSTYTAEETAFALSILTRMLFSVLVDSDSLETEKFYTGKDRFHGYANFDCLKQRLDDYFSSFPSQQPNSINEKRRQIQQMCIDKASGNKGLYSLTVPTGGGKTLSGVAFAINHLLAKGLRRIIYVIPYTSIIEQTAKIFKSVFGDENVLEHHSNFTFEDDFTADENTPQFLATENWDAPIILTTNVQFFESFFSNKRGRCRKLHNITNSVIVFDEAQMLPIPLLKPCLKAIDILTRNFGCTALLMSATYPDYQKYLCKDATVIEINEAYPQHYTDFRRTKAEYIGIKSDSELISIVDLNSQTLIIVNSRKHARKLYNAITDKNCNRYHLSTLMIPKHRTETLKKIRTDLSENKSCVVISTSLVECGVDLDFAAVYRSLAGIDSIIQAGGRCNREGKRDRAKVYVFESDSDPQKGYIPIYKSIARPICIKPQGEDLFDLANIRKYFTDLLEYSDSITDRQKILELFGMSKKPFYLRFDFAKCNEAFKYIENSDRYEIIIPADNEAQRLIEKIRYGKDGFGGALRKLGQYIVSVYGWEYKELQKQGKLEIISDSSLSVLTDTDYYDNDVGLNTPNTDVPDGDLLVI